MKIRSVVAGIFVLCVLCFGAFAASQITSHYPPEMCDQINSALATGTQTTATVTGNATVGDTLTINNALVVKTNLLTGAEVVSNSTRAVVTMKSGNSAASNTMSLALNNGGTIILSTGVTTTNDVFSVSKTGEVACDSTVVAGGSVTATGNFIGDELDANTATALLVGKATATGVTVGAADAHTTVAGNLLVTGVQTNTGAATFNAAVTVNGVLTSTNSVYTAITLNGAQGTAGTVACHTTNGPTSTSVAPEWIPIVHNGSNYWIAAWYKGS